MGNGGCKFYPLLITIVGAHFVGIDTRRLRSVSPPAPLLPPVAQLRHWRVEVEDRVSHGWPVCFNATRQRKDGHKEGRPPRNNPKRGGSKFNGGGGGGGEIFCFYRDHPFEKWRSDNFTWILFSKIFVWIFWLSFRPEKLSFRFGKPRWNQTWSQNILFWMTMGISENPNFRSWNILTDSRI